MNKEDKIYISGHTGLVGRNLMEKLESMGYLNIITASHTDIDLTDRDEVEYLFKNTEPDYVFNCAARVGGIQGNNTYSADFSYENTAIETNIIKCCHDYKVKKLVFLGSSCIYPKESIIPIKEEYFMSGKLEPTNIGYATAKINGIIMCQMFNKQYGDNFISVMPTNLYGRYDNYNLENGHVFPALLRKIHEAKERNDENFTIWGSGNPRREFLFIEDLIDSLLFLIDNYNSSEIINIGTGEDVSIKELAEKMATIIEYKGKFIFDSAKPDGTYRKVLDVNKINFLGWKAKTDISDGIKKTYEYFLEELNKGCLKQ